MINLTAIAEKEKLIDSYIARCDNTTDRMEASKLQEEIIGVFGNEIPNIRASLDRGSYGVGSFVPVDYCGNIKLLKAKLVNHKINIKQGNTFVNNDSSKGSKNGQASVVVQQYNNQSMSSNVSVSITLEQTIENINQLPESALSSDDKELLAGKLAQISVEKEPESRWEKAKGALKWIADKGIEVGIAALPYIVQALTK